jgi:hypothetical protein
MPKYTRKVKESTKKLVAGRQKYKCANNPTAKLDKLENYECPFWKSENEGSFDESGYEIDHIEEFSKTHNDNESNLQALCKSCHSVKTKKYQMNNDSVKNNEDEINNNDEDIDNNDNNIKNNTDAKLLKNNLDDQDEDEKIYCEFINDRIEKGKSSDKCRAVDIKNTFEFWLNDKNYLIKNKNRKNPLKTALEKKGYIHINSLRFGGETTSGYRGMKLKQ